MPRPPSVADIVEEFQAGGRYTFTEAALSRRAGGSRIALKAALRRLKAKKRLASPKRGFFVVVPTEYREVGAPPASWCVDDLLRFLHQPYYVGLLTAAGLHGAAHQQPMEFQVVTDRPTRPLRAGRAVIRFHASRQCRRSPVVLMQTETGTVRVSTPEATAFDLVRFAHAAGHLSNVATVLGELAEKIDASALVRLSKQYAAPDVQRLGYLLDVLGKTDLTVSLRRALEQRRYRPIALAPGQTTRSKKSVDVRWRVRPNEIVEPDR